MEYSWIFFPTFLTLGKIWAGVQQMPCNHALETSLVLRIFSFYHHSMVPDWFAYQNRLSSYITKGETALISSEWMINIYPLHYLLSHVLPQIFKGFVSFSWVAKSFVVDISGKSMVSAALHVDGNQVDANLGVVE